MKVRSVVFAIAAALALFTVRQFESERRYDFGHPALVDAAVFALLWVMAVTHAVIAGIMLAQRADWLPSEASMFRFVAAKAIFWFNFATLFQGNGIGVRLDVLTLYVIIAITTIDLDWRMIARYALGSEDKYLYDESAEWDGEIDRREPGVPGRRFGDAR